MEVIDIYEKKAVLCIVLTFSSKTSYSRLFRYVYVPFSGAIFRRISISFLYFYKKRLALCTKHLFI